MRVRSLGVSLVAQGLSATSNLLFAVLYARAAGAGAFGALSISVNCFVAALGLARAAAGSIALASTDVAAESPGRTAAVLTGAFMIVAAPISAVMLVAACLVPGPVRGPLVGVGLGLPLLLMQDGLRYVGFAHRRPRLPMLLDGAWLITLVIGALVVELTDAPASLLVVAWVAGAALPAIGYLLWHRTGPGLRAGARFLRAHAAAGSRYSGEFAITYAGSFLGFLALGAVGGLRVLGVVRIAFTAVSPLNVLITGITVGATPALRGIESRLARWRAVELATLAAVLCAATGLAWWALPVSWGQAVFGGSWAEARSLVVLAGLSSAMSAAGIAPSVISRLEGLAATSLRLALWGAAPAVALPLLGLLADDRAAGFCAGFALQGAVTIALWARELRRRAPSPRMAIG